MKEPIKVGDLVYVKAWLCCGAGGGVVFKVGSIETLPSVLCSKCGTRFNTTFVVAHNEEQVAGRLCKAPVAWLRKIDPPAEQSTTDTPAELFA